MRKAFSVIWNPHKDETKVHLSKDFKDSDWIVKADVLKDAIYLLTHEYEKVLKEHV